MNLINSSERKNDCTQLICTSGESKIFCRISHNKYRNIECCADLEGQGKINFANECDFGEYVEATVKGELMYKISGVYEIRYDPYDDRFYTSYNIRRICSTNEEPRAALSFPFFYYSNQTGDTISGWHLYCDDRVGDIGFMPTTVVDAMELCQDGEPGIYKANIVVDVFNGTKYHDITDDYLEEHDLLVDEAKAKYNHRIAGYVVSELRLLKCCAVHDTVYVADNMRPALLTEDIDCNLTALQMQYKIRDMYDVGSDQYRNFIKRMLRGAKLRDISDHKTLQYMMRAFRR